MGIMTCQFSHRIALLSAHYIIIIQSIGTPERSDFESESAQWQLPL